MRGHETRADAAGERGGTVERRLGRSEVAADLEQLAPRQPGPARETGLVDVELLDRALGLSQCRGGPVERAGVDVHEGEVAERGHADGCPFVRESRTQRLF